MATLKQLGLTVDDYVAYIRGAELDNEKVKLIEEHWNDKDFPNRASDKVLRKTFYTRRRNNMINEAYCSFEVSKLLKEKGFNIPTRDWYNIYKELQLDDVFYNWNNEPLGKISAVTHQMAMAWLREVHNIHCTIDIGYGSKVMYFSNIFSTKKYSALRNETGYYNSYEEAIEAALLYVLKNLI